MAPLDRFRPGPIGRYYAYVLFASASFTVPIFVLFFSGRGLDLAQIGLMEATWSVVVVAFEAPTGYVADRIGRRNALAVASLLGGLGAVLFTLAHSFPVFLAIVALRGVASTFSSGSRQAWLYDHLAATGRTDDFSAVSGRARSLALAGGVGATVLGSALYALDPTYPWLLEGAIVGASALVVLSLPATGATADDADRLTPVEAALVARDAFTAPAVGGFVAYAALLFATITGAWLLIQPVSVDPVGIPAASLGWLYAGLTLVGAGAAAMAGRVDDRLGLRRWFLLAPLLVGGALLAVLVHPWLAIGAFVIHRAVGSVSNPLFDQYVNDAIGSAGRATVLSTARMVRSLAGAALKLLAGALATWYLLSEALALLGVVVLVGAGLTVWWVRLDPKTRSW